MAAKLQLSGTVAQRTGAHVQELSARVHEIQVMIGRNLATFKTLDDDLLLGLQTLDYLHQSLADIAQLLPYMSDPTAPVEELLDSVRLESTRKIIAGENGLDTPHKSGSLDLF